MKATLLGMAILVTVGAVSGCATVPSTAAATKKAAALETCDQVTGSRTRASREHTDCEPVGYPFRQFTMDQVHSWGENDLNGVFQPRR